VLAQLRCFQSGFASLWAHEAPSLQCCTMLCHAVVTKADGHTLPATHVCTFTARCLTLFGSRHCCKSYLLWFPSLLHVLLQTAGSGKRRRAAAAGSAAGAEESGQSGGLSDEVESSEEGTSGVKPKPASTKKRANPRKPSHPMRSAIDEGSTGSDAKKVRHGSGAKICCENRRCNSALLV
jgi:hypothetical protein